MTSYRLPESISWTNRPKLVDIISNSGTTDSGLVCYCCQFLPVRHHIPKRTCADKRISFWRVVFGFKIFRQNFQSHHCCSALTYCWLLRLLPSYLFRWTAQKACHGSDVVEFDESLFLLLILVFDSRRWFTCLLSFILVVVPRDSFWLFVFVVLLVGHFVFLLFALCLRHTANKNEASAVSSLFLSVFTVSIGHHIVLNRVTPIQEMGVIPESVGPVQEFFGPILNLEPLIKTTGSGRKMKFLFFLSKPWRGTLNRAFLNRL